MLYLNIYLKVLFNKWVKCPFDSIFDTSFSFSFPLISLLSILEAKCPNIYQKRPLLLYEKMCYILSPISTEGNIFSPTSCMQCVVVQLGWQRKAIRDRLCLLTVEYAWTFDLSQKSHELKEIKRPIKQLNSPENCNWI